MLLLDGHSTHCLEAINLVAEEKITMFTLPPHTTHVSQLLDRACFAPQSMHVGKFVMSLV